MSSTQSDLILLLKEGKITTEQFQTLYNDQTKKAKKELTYKVSDKGCISFYGIRKMPITLYSAELFKIVELTQTDEFKKFMEDNKDKIAVKN